MTAPITAAGFFGTVDEIAESKRMAIIGPPFRTASVNDWQPTADAGVNRRVNISIGQAVAYGVLGTTSAVQAVTFTANTGTQNRYDALVATYAWAANTGLGLAARSITFRVITGGTTPPTVNATSAVDNTKINRVKGMQYDALIAVVRVRPSVGLFSSGDVADVRMWAGYEGFANTGTAQYLTLLDTQPGSLVRDVTTDIVWQRIAGGTFGFHSWIGTDKTKQPMLTVRNLTGGGIANNSLVPVFWVDQVDNSGGGFTLTSSRYIQCNWAGRVRIEGFGYSDAAVDGVSYIQVSYPAGGGNYFSTLPDERQRAGATGGYSGAGTLRQVLGPSLIQVQPGDLFDMQCQQVNSGGISLSYQFSMTATYV